MSEVVARRYGEALFDLARERGAVDQWGGQLRAVADIVAGEAVAAALTNPRLAMSERVRIVQGLLEGVAPPVRNLVRLLVERRRLALLPAIVSVYQRLVDEASGVVRARVIAAVPLEGRLREAVAGTLRARLGRDVETEIREDPSIIGGLIIRIGDRVIDTSIRTRLQQLRGALA